MYASFAITFILVYMQFWTLGLVVMDGMTVGFALLAVGSVPSFIAMFLLGKLFPENQVRELCMCTLGLFVVLVRFRLKV